MGESGKAAMTRVWPDIQRRVGEIVLTDSRESEDRRERYQLREMQIFCVSVAVKKRQR